MTGSAHIERRRFLALLGAAISACTASPRELRWVVAGGESRRGSVIEWQALVTAQRCIWTGDAPSDAGAVDASSMDAGGGHAIDDPPAGVAVRYESRSPTLEGLAPPPVLEPGRWAFHLVGRDVRGRTVTAGCAVSMLPLPRGAVLTLTLEPAFAEADTPLDAIRFCSLWSEQRCVGGDEDCDGEADCRDVDCADHDDCRCAVEGSCSECEHCDGALERCVPRGGPCAGGEGTCVGGACCLGCVEGSVCRSGRDRDACGRGGRACSPCPCGCESGVCPCACGADDACAGGACRAGFCCEIDDSNWSISVGDGFACALSPTSGDVPLPMHGNIACFGEGALGQLGDGRSIDGRGWVRCPGYFERCGEPSVPMGSFVAVAAGRNHACAVLYRSASETRLACWGDGRRGQLGVGDFSRRPGPGFVVGSGTLRPTAFLAVAVGDEFGCGLSRDSGPLDAGNFDGGAPDAGPAADSGWVWCWGSSENGRNGGHPDSAVPRWLRAVPQSRQIAAGRAHGCALTTAGEVWCWGANGRGQVSGAPGPDELTPRRVRIGPYERLFAGGDHTCAVSRRSAGDYDLECWGRDLDSELSIAGRFGHVPAVALGAAHACVLDRGSVRCAGRGEAFGVPETHATPVEVLAGREVLSLAAGGGELNDPASPRSFGSTCAVLREGGVWCAGEIDCERGICEFRRMCLPP